MASITKTVTATAVMQLREAGAFRLDDPAIRFIPELERLVNAHGSLDDLSIRRLLMHTSGLQGELPWQDLDRFWFYRPDQLGEILHLGAVRTLPEAGYWSRCTGQPGSSMPSGRRPRASAGSPPGRAR